MKIYLDLQKQAITKTTDENIYQGDIYSNAFEILFYNYTDSNWFPTMSQLAPNGRKAGEFTADALDVGESHEYTEDGVTYLKFTFTMGTSWVLMKGRSEFYIWFNRLGGAIVQKKCVGVVNIMIDHSTEDYFIADPTFNPNVKAYIDACIAELGDGSPKYFDTASNIANCTEDKGLAVATNTGHLYYWDETKNSTTKYTDSGLVYNDLSNYYTKTQMDALLAQKVNKADVADNLTTNDSDKVLSAKQGYILKAMLDALDAGKQDVLTFDSTPTANSTNPVTSGGVKTALDTKADKADVYNKDEVDTKDLNLAGQIAGARVELNNRINTTDGILTAIQAEVAKLESVQNVVDVVATKSALNSYDTTKLDVNDKVQVIADETHDGASTIYNWNGSAWQYIGAFGGNSYTKAETYNKTQIDSALSDKADKSNTYTRAVIDSMILTLSTDKADKSNTYTKTEIDNTMQEVWEMFEIVGNEVLKKADKTELNSAINDLRWELGSHTLDVTTDTDVAFSKSVPSGAIGCQINKVGGMSYKSENLLNVDNTFSYKPYTETIYFDCVGGANYTLKSFGTYTGSFSLFYYDGTQWSAIESHTLSGGYTITAPNNATRIGCNGVTSNQVMAVKGSTAPTEFKPYFSGIRDSAVTSVKSNGANLLQLNDVVETTTNGITYKVNSTTGTITMNGTATNSTFINVCSLSLTAGTYYFKSFGATGSNSTYFSYIQILNDGVQAYSYQNGSFTLTETTTIQMLIAVRNGVTVDLTFKDMLVVGSTAPTEFKAYRGTIDTLEIPIAIQNLTGYGQSNPDDTTQYNYIDFVDKTFVRVGYIDNDAWVTSALVTDISAYLTRDSIDVEGGGSIEFTNTYSQDVPSDIDYLIEEVKA